MKFTVKGRTMGDETTPFEVTEYKSKTVVEFIAEVLELRPDEWGYIAVRNGRQNFLSSRKIEYRCGELMEGIPEEWQIRKIVKIDACGGWSRMDYLITASIR